MGPNYPGNSWKTGRIVGGRFLDFVAKFSDFLKVLVVLRVTKRKVINPHESLEF
jgi:hypothetical protein